MRLHQLSRTACHIRWFTTEAGPRPFPLPFNVGTDIANIRRFDNMIRNDQLPKASGGTDDRFLLDYKNMSSELTWTKNFLRRTFNYVEWYHIRFALTKYLENPALTQKFAEYLASRWSAKEATIKACTTARLNYRDVIVTSMLTGDGQRRIPVALINPPKPAVLMSRDVAKQRGLWIPTGGIITEHTNVNTFQRQAKSKMSERQVARLSISHDSDYTIAVAHVANESQLDQDLEPLVDDGTGDPIHEPLIGDEGYDSYDLFSALKDYRT